jgi:hypothetical protein
MMDWMLGVASGRAQLASRAPLPSSFNAAKYEAQGDSFLKVTPAAVHDHESSSPSPSPTSTQRPRPHAHRHRSDL